jgi:hypothetical protein
MSAANRALGPRVLGVCLILTAIITVAYWADYFTSAEVAVVPARWYTAFESSFPVADCWIALTSLLAGVGFWRGSPRAGALGLLAGSALLYLAAMDITFNLENGLYPLARASNAMRFEMLINAWSLGFGVVTTVVGWRRARLRAII